MYPRPGGAALLFQLRGSKRNAEQTGSDPHEVTGYARTRTCRDRRHRPGASAPGASAAYMGDSLEAGGRGLEDGLSEPLRRSRGLSAAGALARRAVYDAAAAESATFGGAWFDTAAGVVDLRYD